MLHKRDMDDLSFCKLNFPHVLADNKVRKRAIAERIAAIGQNPYMKNKFEKEFDRVKK